MLSSIILSLVMNTSPAAIIEVPLITTQKVDQRTLSITEIGERRNAKRIGERRNAKRIGERRNAKRIGERRNAKRIGERRNAKRI